MNYQKHYDQLIFRARHRHIRGYKEKHHVIPRCMGGDNSKRNIVRLTPEEHFVAHQLLVKMHPGCHKLAYAAGVMAIRGGANKIYGWLRRAMVGNTLSDAGRAKVSAARKGKKLSPEHCKKLSDSHKGKTNSPEACEKISKALTGKKRSPEACAAISAGSKGKTLSPEHCEKISKLKKGTHHSPETCARISKGGRGLKRSPETCARISAARRLRPSPMLGRHHSPEGKANISAGRTGKGLGWKHTPEMIAYMSAVNKQQAIWVGKKHTEETKVKMVKSALKRWYGDGWEAVAVARGHVINGTAERVD